MIDTIKFDYNKETVRLQRDQEVIPGKLSFKNRNWEVEVIRESSDEDGCKFFRIKIAHWEVQNDDGHVVNSVLFCYWCTCFPVGYDDYLVVKEVCDPATCKEIDMDTVWHFITPAVSYIYSQLKEEMQKLPTQGEIAYKVKETRELVLELLRLDREKFRQYPGNYDEYVEYYKNLPRVKVIWSMLEDWGVMCDDEINTESWFFQMAFGKGKEVADIIF